jgi:mono/diheme cytochrome c family protein
MRPSPLLPVVAVVLAGTTAAAVEPSDLKPGLVATFQGSDPRPSAPSPPGSAAPTVTRLEPTVALSLAAGEAPHPKLAGLRSAVWKGYVNVVRPGKYTFSANVANGTLRLKVGGRAVLEATGSAPAATRSSGEAVSLDGGVQPIEASFTATGTPCRVELFWQGPGFITEPLNDRFLGHLAQERPASFVRDVEQEHGRFKFEELACLRCHRPAADDPMAKTLVDRPGPILTEVARRAYAGWIFSWLADPARHRPQTTMPKLFADDARGTAERYAVTQYLVALAGGKPLDHFKQPLVVANDVKQSFERGRVLYTVTGCATCHRVPKPKDAPSEDDRDPLRPEDYIHGLGTLAGPAAKYDLGNPGSKTRPEALAAFLQDPLKTHPAGRMPDMRLSPQEATDLARYLCRLTDERTDPGMPSAPKADPAALLDKPDAALAERFAALKPAEQWVEAGRAVFRAKGCGNCHAVEEKKESEKEKGKGRPRPVPDARAFPTLEQVSKAGAAGCLSEKPDPAQVPVYRLQKVETAALVAFLKDGLSGAGSPATAYAARVALRRFNCLNCHARDGEGGIPADLADEARLLEKAENADDVRPPLLTGIGHKSRTAWLKSVLVSGGRARPWMQLRMPQYGESNVGFLPEALAHLEGTLPDDTVHKVELGTQRIALGRQIVGKGGLGCISCHDIGGVANTGTRGPDLSTINQRVRYEWYERWLHQPLRMAPGTRMPQAFVDGKSTLPTVLNGDPKAQAQAMWAYLSLGPGLPLPEGLEPPKGLIVAVKDRPEVLRTFLDEAGTKAIAVGYPGGVNLAFAADQCRLAFTWAGNFLDASPVWNNRGGAPAKLLGPKLWSAPNGHPWGLTANPRIPPDFAAREKNPAFGTPLPLEPARTYDGPRAVNFLGYALDDQGRPTFRYRLTGNDRDAVLKVAETPRPIPPALATGLIRQFALEAPAGYTAWLLAGQTAKQPRVLDATATNTATKRLTIDLTAEEPAATAAGSRVVLPQDGNRIAVLEAVNTPPGTVWRFVPRSGGGWLAVLRLPAANAPWKGTFELRLWVVPLDDDTLLKDLTAK